MNGVLEISIYCIGRSVEKTISLNFIQRVQPNKHWFWAKNGFGNKLHGAIALA